MNRRRFERFEVDAMYTPVRVRRLDDPVFAHAGHAYDISEGGVRFELDEPIDPGTPIAIQIALPTGGRGWDGQMGSGPGRAVFVLGNVVWVCEEDLPGPVRCAAAFTRFARAGDRERLMHRLVAGRFARAA